MIKKIFQKLLFKTGKSYKLDSQIPDQLLIVFLFERLVMMIRGLLFLRGKIFLGQGCSIKNKRNFHFGKNYLKISKFLQKLII
mgnify:CR=1 FL=1